MWSLRLSRRQRQGQLWEQQALGWLRARGLELVEENFRCRGGEIDLIMRERGTLVFVEVRQRANADHGGALASITPAKIRRLVHAANTYLLRWDAPPPCRFDVIAIDGAQPEWLQNVLEL